MRGDARFVSGKFPESPSATMRPLLAVVFRDEGARSGKRKDIKNKGVLGVRVGFLTKSGKVGAKKCNVLHTEGSKGRLRSR